MAKDQDKDTPASKEDKDVNLDDTKNNSTKDDASGDGDKGNAYLNQKKRAELAEKERDEAIASKAELEAKLAEKADSQGEVSDEDLAKFAEDNDVSPEFVKGLMTKFESKLSKKTDELINSRLSEKEKEEAKKTILNDFKKDFDKIGDDWEGGELSETAVRMHYLTEKAKNPEHTVEDSVEEIYGSFKKGKATAEDDPRGADTSGETIDFAKLSKDPEKLDKVLKDPKARTKYYNWRDSQGM